MQFLSVSKAPHKWRLTKILRVMKISTFLLLLTMQLSAAVSYSQEKVTLSLKEGKLTEVLKEIEGQTGYKIFYNNRLVEMAKPISLEIEEADLEEALNLIFKDQPLDYEIVEKTIVVKKKATKKKGKGDNASTSQYDFEDPVTVTGKVTDYEGLPLPGVTIRIKGTQQGTLTDAEGNYSITTEETNTLVFSYIGMVTIEEAIGSRTTINVTLQESATQLQDVVVNAGYYETTERTKTGNIVKIEAKEFENQSFSNPLMALQGRVAGFDITPTNGAVGAAPQIEIRGRNSLRIDGGFPLYVIDGVPVDSSPFNSRASSTTYGNTGYDPLSTLSPDNIETIEVLKDGSATAIYGSRGANGVILITTKKPTHRDGISIDMNIYNGSGRVSKFVDLLDTEEYLQMRKTAYINDGVEFPTISNSTNYDLTLWSQDRYTDWQKVLIGGQADVSSLRFGISSGNSNTVFRLGANYYKETTILPGNFGFKRYNVNLSLNHSSSDNRLKLNTTFNYGFNSNDQANIGNYIVYALTLPPNAPNLYNLDGTLNWEPEPGSNGVSETWENPLADLTRRSESNSNTLIANNTLSYSITPTLIVKSNLGYTESQNYETITTPIVSVRPSWRRYGSASFSNSIRNTWILEPQIIYSKTWNLHKADITSGYSLQGSNSSYNSISGSGYTSDLALKSILGAPNIDINTDQRSQYRYEAIFARIGYNYGSKYFINFTGRRDGSSRFGPGKQYGSFIAGGLAWVFTNETFSKINPKFLSFGKVRASYGITGNDQISDYQFLETYDINSSTYLDAISISPTSLFNNDLAWEKTKKTEFALELGFLNDRLFLETSRYIHRSSNQLIQYTLPATTGFESIASNFDAIVENSGWEFMIQVSPISKTKINWDLSANISIPKNELVEYPAIEDSPYSTTYKVGEPLSIRRQYIVSVNSQTGEYQVQDTNQDGRINSLDLQFTDSYGRNYYGGINNSITYGNINLTALFQFSELVGSGIGSTFPQNMPGMAFNQPQIVLDKIWENDGDTSNFGIISQSSTNRRNFYSYTQRSTLNNNTVRYIRLKSLSLSYNLPSTLIDKLNLSNLKVYLEGQNLFVIGSNGFGFDPETGSNFPNLRRIAFGIELKM